jgi:hypothetical protein
MAWHQAELGAPEPARVAEMTTVGLDTSVANAARIYDYLLGGKDNYLADRDAGEQILACIPHAQRAARQNREFLGRVVEFLAGIGYRQFVDIGSGLPTQSNVHEIAQRVDPASCQAKDVYGRRTPGR